MTIRSRESILVARVVDAFGVKGQIKLHSFTEKSSNLLNYQDWILDIPEKGRHPYTVETSKMHGRFLVASLTGVDDRDKALNLKGAEVYVSKESLPKLDADEYYWSELIGLKVVNIDGTEYGYIDQIMETGANEVLVVVGESTKLIPFISDAIHSVDLIGSVVCVEWFENF